MKRSQNVFVAVCLLCVVVAFATTSVQGQWHDTFRNLLIRGKAFVGTGTPTVTQGQGDLFVSDDIEADGNVEAATLSVAGVTFTATPAEVNAVCDANTATAAEIIASSDLSVQGALIKSKAIAFTSVPAAEVDTAWDLPAQALVLGVSINVSTAEATGGTKTIDIGTLSSEGGGDADGFANGISVAATGLIVPQASVTTGSTETYYSANTWGALLTEGYVVGTDAAGDFGLFERKPYDSRSQTAKSVSYSPGSGDFAELQGEIVIWYIEVN